MTSKPLPYRCPSCIAETPPSYFGRLVWLEQETGPVVCRYHRGKDGKIVPVEMELVPPREQIKAQLRVILGLAAA